MQIVCRLVQMMMFCLLIRIMVFFVLKRKPMWIMCIILPRIRINNINEEDYFNYSDLFQRYKEMKEYNLVMNSSKYYKECRFIFVT